MPFMLYFHSRIIMSDKEKIQGRLTFDVIQGKFWVTGSEGEPLTSIDFGDTFEVLENDEWKKTSLKIINGDNGDLVFQLTGTSYYGILDDLEVRI